MRTSSPFDEQEDAVVVTAFLIAEQSFPIETDAIKISRVNLRWQSSLVPASDMALSIGGDEYYEVVARFLGRLIRPD